MKEGSMRKRLLMALAAVTALGFLGGCTSGTTKNATGTSTAGGTAASNSAEAARAPGVTNDAIKIGVTYVDTKALQASGLNLNLGDYQGSYKAVIDQINNAGGINGRKIQAVYVPINPIGTAPAQAACAKLTQDEKVFAAVGFFLNDAVLCPVQTQNTAVIGGTQTPQWLAEAKAPWFTTTPGTETAVNAVKAFDDKNLLTGKIGVFAHVADVQTLNLVMDELKRLGVDATKAVLDAPAGDQSAITSGTQTIAQRFQTQGIHKVMLVGDSSADWFLGMKGQSYKPQLLISDATAVQAFLSNKSTSDTSLLKDAVEGLAYSQGTWIYDEPAMQSCFKTIKAAGVAVPQPNPNDANAKGYTGPEDACTNMALLEAILKKAGKTLNYATFRNAGYTLGKVTIPGDPSPRTYGPPPATDGAPTVHVLYWDEGKQDFVAKAS
jgi:ABC-type branched-subunit amino acid transport system substrate-binding protein